MEDEIGIDAIVEIAKKYDMAALEMEGRARVLKSALTFIEKSCETIIKEINEESKMLYDRLSLKRDGDTISVKMLPNEFTLGNKRYREEGFEILFYPSATARITVEAVNHHINGTEPEKKIIKVYDDFNYVKNQEIVEVFYKAFNAVYRSCYLFK